MILNYIAYGCFALAGIFLALSVYLFFAANIKRTIYELSGKARAETTENMIKNYAQTGTLRHTGLTDTLATTGERDINNSLMFTDGLRSGKTSQRPSGSTGKRSTQLPPSSGGLKLVKDIVVTHTEERI